MLTRLLIAALVCLASTGLAPAVVGPGLPPAAELAIEQISIGELREYVEQLASDAFAGRGLGQPGNQQAEAYIAKALEDAGVRAAGGSYLQPVGIYTPKRGGGSALTISNTDGGPFVEVAADDFFPLPSSADRPVNGPLVFAGHGLTGPGRHDDYKGLDVKGAVVLAIESAPAWMQQSLALSDTQKAELGSIERKLADARAHGAAALIVVREHLSHSAGDWSAHVPQQRLLAELTRAPLGVFALSARAAAPIRKALEDGARLIARLTPGVVLEPVTAHNVLGLIEGRDPAAGMLVVGAHLDHDGVDESGQVYNGADDNASGTAAVIAVAAAFARAAADGHRPARAVVFALWNAEEQGSLGAAQFLSAPVPARPIIASFNLDMVGRAEDTDPADARFYGFRRTTAARSGNTLHMLGYSYSPDLARIVDRANASVRLTIRQDYDRGAQNLIQRSDQWPFLKQGVPAIFLTTGLHPDYHTPADDTERIDFPKLERITELVGRAAWLAADGEPPRFRGR